jgi:hypothetical protein
MQKSIIVDFLPFKMYGLFKFNNLCTSFTNEIHKTAGLSVILILTMGFQLECVKRRSQHAQKCTLDGVDP